MRLSLSKFAALNQNAAGSSLNCSPISIFSPLHKCAIAEADRTLTINLRNLVARFPESAVAYANDSFVCSTNFDHGWIVAMKRGKFCICDKESIGGSLFNKDGAIAISFKILSRTDTYCFLGVPMLKAQKLRGNLSLNCRA
jgi:hypothetical protein